MPADAKLGMFVGLCLVLAAAWVYRQGTPTRPDPEQPAAATVGTATAEPVLLPESGH